MSLNFEITVNESWSITKSDNKVSQITIENSDEKRYQTATLVMFSLSESIEIGDDIVIDINGDTYFSGHVSSIKQSAKGLTEYNVQLIGNTYNLWRYHIDSSNQHTFYNDYSTNHIRTALDENTDITYTNVPADSGIFLKGAYEFENESVGELVMQMAKMDGYNFYVDEDNDLHYYNITSTQAITISEGDIISYTPFQKSDDNLYNDIIVIGNGVSSRVTNSTSINTYGRYLYKMNDSRIDDEDDAETLANKILDEYKDPVWYGSVTINGNLSVEIGKKFTFNLSKLNITGTHKLKSYTHKIDKNGFTTKLDFGREKYDPSREIALLKNQMLETHYGIFAGLSEATNAASTADGKIVTFFQDSEPSSGESSLGDLWFDTDDDNKLYRYNGASWVAARDDGISDAISAASNAQSTADSKIVVYYSATTSPPASPSQGDLWVQTNNNDYIKVYDSGSWRDVGDYYTYWSNQVDDDGTMPDPNADLTGDNNQLHSWLLDNPKNAHHPSYLVNGQVVTDTSGGASGNWVDLTDFSLHCDCLLVSTHEYSMSDMVQGTITIRDKNDVTTYSDNFQNCSMDGSYLYGFFQTTHFIPSGGSWRWIYGATTPPDDDINLYKEHLISLETDT